MLVSKSNHPYFRLEAINTNIQRAIPITMYGMHVHKFVLFFYFIFNHFNHNFKNKTLIYGLKIFILFKSFYELEDYKIFILSAMPIRTLGVPYQLIWCIIANISC